MQCVWWIIVGRGRGAVTSSGNNDNGNNDRNDRRWVDPRHSTKDSDGRFKRRDDTGNICLTASQVI
jgi:hypothetical protein